MSEKGLQPEKVKPNPAIASRGNLCLTTMSSVLTEFERGRIVGARQAGASIAATSKLIGVSPATVCRIMADYEDGKTSPGKSTGRKKKLDSRQQRSLKRIVKSDRRISAVKATAALNDTMDTPISTRTVRRELHNMNLHGRAAISKPLIREQNAIARKRWCKEHEGWTADQWKKVVWSDESSFTLFPTTGRVYVWRSPEEAYNTDCLLPTVKHGGGSVMVWGAISWHAFGPILSLKGKVKAEHYEGILNDQVIEHMMTLSETNDLKTLNFKPIIRCYP